MVDCLLQQCRQRSRSAVPHGTTEALNRLEDIFAFVGYLALSCGCSRRWQMTGNSSLIGSFNGRCREYNTREGSVSGSTSEAPRASVLDHGLAIEPVRILAKFLGKKDLRYWPRRAATEHFPKITCFRPLLENKENRPRCARFA